MKKLIDLAYGAFVSDMKYVLNCCKDIYNDGDIDWISGFIICLLLFIVGFFCIAFPKTTIVIFLISWRLYSYSVYGNDSIDIDDIDDDDLDD